jgi:hypothetical protein
MCFRDGLTQTGERDSLFLRLLRGQVQLPVDV